MPGSFNSRANICLLIAMIVLPLSCSGQKNILRQVSSAERSDQKGYVIRFHLSDEIASAQFSQPQARLIELELLGSNITPDDVQLNDPNGVFETVKFYRISGGLGADIILSDDDLYKAQAYPDRTGNDYLVALGRTSARELTDYTATMQQFAWSAVSATAYRVASGDDAEPAAVDTSYQMVKDKIKFDTVVLDAGHGGRDVGTNHNGVYEKDVVLSITKKVGAYINENLPDVQVVYTRTDDRLIDLYQRGPIANRAEGDLFVSIHANAVPSAPSAHGTETYFLGLERSKSALKVMERENTVVDPDGDKKKKKLTQEDLIVYELANSGYIENSQKLAAMVEGQFENRAKRNSRGVKQARFVVLYQASMPAILIETGFISNKSEANYLTSEYGQNIIASAIFRAIRNYKEQFDRSQHFNTK